MYVDLIFAITISLTISPLNYSHTLSKHGLDLKLDWCRQVSDADIATMGGRCGGACLV